MLQVTAALAGVGVVAGTLVCWMALGVLGVFMPESFSGSDPDVLRVALPIGAVVGGIVGPVVAWAMLRRVPLWLAVAGTALAGTVAAVASALLVPALPYGWLWCSFGAIVAAAHGLRRRFEVPQRPIPRGTPDATFRSPALGRAVISMSDGTTAAWRPPATGDLTIPERDGILEQA